MPAARRGACACFFNRCRREVRGIGGNASREPRIFRDNKGSSARNGLPQALTRVGLARWRSRLNLDGGSRHGVERKRCNDKRQSKAR